VTQPASHIPTLVTDRLILRGATRADVLPFRDMMSEPRTQYMGGPFDARGAWQFLTGAIASWQLDGFGGWILENRTTGAFLGEVMIAQPPRFPEPELGWTLSSDAEGQGFAFEAAQSALTWWWSHTDKQTLVSYVSPANARSAALAVRLGAQPDPNGPWPDGEDADETTVYRHRRPQ